MLAVAHSELGKLPWSSLFAGAERTARDGFIVSPRLSRLLEGDYAENRAPDVVAYFGQGPGGRRVRTGDRLGPLQAPGVVGAERWRVSQHLIDHLWISWSRSGCCSISPYFSLSSESIWIVSSVSSGFQNFKISPSDDI